ncbi:MAG: trehalose-6-phosphate synthase [Syntrophobacteraceae bacterium]
MEERRLAVVSNRLPIVLKREKTGDWKIEPGSGGLITAIGPVLRNRGGLWIGWLGVSSEKLTDFSGLDSLLRKGAIDTGYCLKPVQLSAEEVHSFYYGFSNEILWPLFHDFPTRCNFNPDYWPAYERVNKKFAHAIVENTREEDFVWVHDYQLILTGAELIKLGARRHTGFFMHIPFPPLDVFIKLPWRFAVLDALMQYDLIGFQTERDRRNFIACVRALTRGVRVLGQGHVCRLITPDREVRVGSFPISIDFKEFANLSAMPDTVERAKTIRANLPNRMLIFGVDRLDYTKGIPNRLNAVDKALERYPELRRKITLVQVIVPSRETIKEYGRLKREIERMIGEINGRYTEVGWTPITYIFGSLSRAELVSYYQACEMALITPLKDGMNLVAKEYCASNIHENGVLILSEFAGAAASLQHGALLVNPYDVDGVADAIYQAFRMKPAEKRDRMKTLRRSIRKHDIYRWVASFLEAGIAEDLRNFPLMELFVPKRKQEAFTSKALAKKAQLAIRDHAATPSTRKVAYSR